MGNEVSGEEGQPASSEQVQGHTEGETRHLYASQRHNTKVVFMGRTWILNIYSFFIWYSEISK